MSKVSAVSQKLSLVAEFQLKECVGEYVFFLVGSTDSTEPVSVNSFQISVEYTFFLHVYVCFHSDRMVFKQCVE